MITETYMVLTEENFEHVSEKTGISIKDLKDSWLFARQLNGKYVFYRDGLLWNYIRISNDMDIAEVMKKMVGKRRG